MMEKYITALDKIKTPFIQEKSDLIAWQATATNLVSRIYGDNSKQEKQINHISFQDFYGHSNGSLHVNGNNAYECQKRIADLINSIITDIKNFGIPEKIIEKSDNAGGINISLNQNQTVNINIIWNSIKDELNENQQKEIKSIIESKKDAQYKKKEIIAKLKSFGADLGTNILASILTNPAIFG